LVLRRATPDVISTDLGRGVIHLASVFRLPAEFKHPGFSLPPETGTSHYTRENYAVTWVQTNLPSLVKRIDGTSITPLQELSVDGTIRNPRGQLPDTLLHLKEDLSRLTYLQVNFPDAQLSPSGTNAHSYVEDLAPVHTLSDGAATYRNRPFAKASSPSHESWLEKARGVCCWPTST
jgi:hypothetical protein